MSDVLNKVREVLATMFASGLNAIDQQTLWKLRESLETGGFQRSVAMVEDLAAQKDASGRFKSFTKLLLAIRQLELAITPFPKLKAGGFVAVPGLHSFAIPQGYAAIGASELRPFFETKRFRVPGHYLVSEKLDPLKLALPDLVPILSHSFYREMAIERLKSLPDERREQLANRLLELKNCLLRRAGVSLLASLGARVSAMKSLLPLLADPGIGRDVQAYFMALGNRACTAIGTVADSPDDAVREQACKMLRQLADPRAEPALKRMVNDRAPAVRSWAKLALFASTGRDTAQLAPLMAEKDNAIVRIIGKAELVRAKKLPPTRMLEELGEGGWRNFKLTIPAIAELAEADMLLKSTLTNFLSAPTREARRTAFEMLQHLPDSRYRWLFRMAASDCDPDIARKGLEILVRAEGFGALEANLELGPVLTRPCKLTEEEKQYAMERVMPHIPAVGDCRFVPYLVETLQDRCRFAVAIEYTYSLRPMLIEYGAPIASALKELTKDSNPNISGPAREVHGEIGAKL
ncbi:MAG: HEAT repeat domain-containing protein [Candidatus Wallbacteria bacterium]|nr:HEAT repeat domain-containing protein [Candidatus Wallbacteria bacterium]